MSFMLHPLSSDLTRWHVVNSREARVRRAVFANVGVQWNTTQKGARTDQGDSTGVAEDSDVKPDGMRQQKYYNNIWQSPSRGKIGDARERTWSQWNAQGGARTSSDRVYRLQNRVMIRGNTLGGARWLCGYRDAGDECRSTETKTKLTCNNTNNWRRDDWHWRPTGDSGRPSRRTDERV